MVCLTNDTEFLPQIQNLAANLLRLRDTLYYRKSKLRERNVFALVWF